MTRHAVLIGVNQVPGLEYLTSPSRYAMEMEDWARSQGYQTALFVDEPKEGRTVAGNCLRTEILCTIREFVKDTDQLLIYFAGHGVEHNAGNDVWLLPGYQDDPNDCISLFLNKALVYSTGVPHVVFISDACRSPSDSEDLRAASGSAIFPKLDKMNPSTEVDVLYSTWPGQISVDVKNASGEYRSIYSDHLIQCLNGHVPEVITEIKNITPGFPAVLSDELNRYLKKTVPMEMAGMGREAQYPMGDVMSRDPRFLSSFTESDLVAESGEAAWQYKDKGHEIKGFDTKFKFYMKMSGSNKQMALNRIKKKSVQFQDFFTSESILKDNVTSLFITGIDNPLVYSSNAEDQNGFSGKNYAVPQEILYGNNEDEYPKVFLVGNRKKRLYPVNILKGFFTHVIFEKGELLTVNYYPSDRYRKWEANVASQEIAERKAVIIAAAKNGIFQGNEDIASYLRSYKSLDPILGLFAAYAYFQKGNYEGVNSVYRYMDRDGANHIIGDLRLLRMLSGNREHFDNGWNIPLLPVLTEGWSYLKMLENHPYDYLSTQLIPGLWASFNENGMMYLIDSLNFKRI
ncbi:MAG: caspase family protein [Sphingobacterium sp.]|jgi:hypothetical protein|nr:caspase family protein [Sphingobacterium sp.]